MTLEEYGIRQGIGKGFKTYLWLMKVLVPISLGVVLLQWTGLLSYAEFVLKPLMALLRLPPEAALPLIAGLVAAPGAALATMVALPLTQAQMTLMAIFVLIAHGFPHESVIQGRSGFPPLKASLVRLAAAILTVLAVAPFLDLNGVGGTAAQAVAQADPALSAVLLNWLGEVGRLVLILFCIIMTIMILLEVIRAKGWIDPVVRVLSPLLRALGLSPQAGVLWVTAAIFGLAFGAAVIVEEAESGRISQEDLETLQLSIGINHGLFDDPALFLSLGLNPFWIYIPRLLTAVIAVRLLTLWRKLKRRRTPA